MINCFFLVDKDKEIEKDKDEDNDNDKCDKVLAVVCVVHTVY